MVEQSSRDAIDNEAVGEMIARLTNDQTALLKKRARRARAIIIAGIVWSFVYTATSIFVMANMSTQTHETCEQFAESRAAIRALILSDPDFNDIEVDKVAELLPPIEC